MRTTLRRLGRAALLGAAAATLVNLASIGWDHSQPLTTGCATKRADAADSCTEGDARLFVDAGSAGEAAEHRPEPLRELARLASYRGAFQGCSAPLGDPGPGMAWNVCLPERASLVDAGDDVRLGA